MTNEHASSQALSATVSSAKASPLPMVLIALIVSVLRGPRHQCFKCLAGTGRIYNRLLRAGAKGFGIVVDSNCWLRTIKA